MPKSIFIVGSGPMIGSHVARLFATKGFQHVALISRSDSNLARDAAFVNSAAAAPSASILTYVADVTDVEGLKKAIFEAVLDLGPPEVVVYNAARIQPGKFGEYSAGDMIDDFRIPNVGLYTTAMSVLPHLKELARSNPEAHPALFVTSGAIIHQPLAPVFSLCMAKAAQASLTQVMAAENKEVHVALVTVGGEVSPDELANNPANIATKFWELYEQKQGQWQFEMKVGW